MSQPVIRDSGQENSLVGDNATRNVINPGEFVLGYPNGYGKQTPWPKLSGVAGGEAFGRNGTFLVFRQLAQDVAGFRVFLRDNARLPLGSHIRRTNPRDSLGADAAKALERANLHRILRRGRVYGPGLGEGASVDDGQDRGGGPPPARSHDRLSVPWRRSVTTCHRGCAPLLSCRWAPARPTVRQAPPADQGMAGADSRRAAPTQRPRAPSTSFGLTGLEM